MATNATNSDINLRSSRSQNVQISHIVGQPYGVIWNVICRNDDGWLFIKLILMGSKSKDGGNKQLGQVPLHGNNSFTYKILVCHF
jgi:hypothetical protein